MLSSRGVTFEHRDISPKTSTDELFNDESISPDDIDKQISDKRSNITKSLENCGVRNLYNDVIERVLKPLSNFSSEIDIDYHIVLIDKRLDKRFSIIEKVNPDYSSKNLYYGVVGAVLRQEMEQHQTLMVQFRQSINEPTIVYNSTQKGPVLLKQKVVEQLSLSGNETLWNPETQDFAIAATVIRDSNNRTVGACSIDFSSKNKEYPYYSFRRNEIELVFDTLYTMRKVFECFFYIDAGLIRERKMIDRGMKEVIKTLALD